jgi:hypothetical protein
MSSAEETRMRDAIRDGLRAIGYTDDLRSDGYAFPDFLSGNSTGADNLLRVEVAAFAQRPFSYRSACFGVIVPPNESPNAIRPYRALGAPQILALHPSNDYVRRWKVGAEGLPQDLGTIPYSEIPSAFRQHEEEWKPQRVLRAKSIAFVEEDRQLDFYDIGLIPALDASLRQKLHRELHNILARCKEVYEEHHKDQLAGETVEALFRLIFRLVAAKMLIDRGDRLEWSDLPVNQVVAKVEEFYFGSQPAENVLQDARVQRAAWELLRDRLNLQNLSVETLAYIYENTLVSEPTRREQGVHATPHEIAEYMVRHLPIHELPAEERRIFEPFAGHAPFLISALGLLRELLPAEMPADERHHYFVRMLSGLESDAFAQEIARYSLILADYPNRDSWRVAQADAFTDPRFDQYLSEAGVVFCNPPYGTFSPEQQTYLPKDATTYKESEALRRVMASRPPILGFVLPRTFLDRRDFRQLRLDIVARYSDVSVTVLPEKTFSYADSEVVLLLAHSLRHSGASYRSALVDKDDYEQFVTTGKPTWEEEHTTVLHRGNDDVILWRTPLQRVWDAVATLPHLGDFISLRRGIQYKLPVSECVSDDERDGFVPGVQTINGYLQAYTVQKHQYLCTQPEIMMALAYQLPWHQPKVLINRSRLSRGYWHIAGAVDEMELVASQRYYGIWPNSNIPVEVLAALINGPICNAFLYDYRASRDNNAKLINRIPIPAFSPEQIAQIVSLVQDYQKYRCEWLDGSQRENFLRRECYSLLLQIDAAILEAYNLPADLENELLRKFDGVPRRGLPFEFTGYGVDYDRAKAALAERRRWRALVSRYQELVNKDFISGLTTAEAQEVERLGAEMDAEDDPTYDRFLKTVQAGKR